LEKDALAGVIRPTVAKWGVTLVVSRGQSSITVLHDMGGRAPHVLALYDFDAGGKRGWNAVARAAPSAERLALTPEQIEEWDLPTRKPNPKDTQADAWGDTPCCELDAIDPKQLVSLVEDAITSHIDWKAWKAQERIQAKERKRLQVMEDGFQL
jgi:hypothetical protein